MDGETCQPMTRDVAPLEFRAAFEVGSVDPAKRTATVTWTTGAPVLRGAFSPYYEELSLDPKHVRMQRLNNGAPLMSTHLAQGGGLPEVIGVVESASLERGRGSAVVRFAKAEDDPEADKIFRKVQDKIIRNVSVGYRTYRAEQAGESSSKIPTVLATDWEPFEITVVPAGADDGAGFRAAEARAEMEQAPHRPLNPCIFTHRKETRTMADATNPTPKPVEPAVVDPTEQLVVQARQENQRATAAAAEQVRQATDQAVELERQRITEIGNLARMTKLGDALAERLIKAKTPLDEARQIVLRELARDSDSIQTDGHIRFEAGEDKSEKFVRGACAGILFRSGLTGVIEEAKKSPRLAAEFRDVDTDPGEFRRMRLIDMARTALEMRGVSTKGLFGEQLIKRALQYRDAGMNTTSDFAILLETAVNKTFLGQYAITPVTWPRWCGRKSVQDFRTATFYRPGSFGTLDTVTEGGEVKHKNIPDGEKATLAAATKGNIIGITRRAIVNDDMGAFQNLASGLGQAAAFTIEADAFALITVNTGLGPTQTDGQPLFHSNRSNIGTSGAMSVATWDGSAAIMASQKDVSKNMVLDLAPAVWLGPRTMLLAARTLNENGTDPTSNKTGVSNPVRGMVRDLVGTARLPGTGGSSTRHYFLADPALYAVFAVGFIDGQEAPVITSQESFEYDGLQIKVVLDYGTAVLDYRGAVATPGA